MRSYILQYFEYLIDQAHRSSMKFQIDNRGVYIRGVVRGVI